MKTLSNIIPLNINKVSKLTFHFMIYLLVLSCASCNNSTRKADVKKIVTEWAGKVIQFPEDVNCYVMGKDTISSLCSCKFTADYKILLYVDSTGCSSCRLNLYEWVNLIEEADSLFQNKLSFLFYFQPKSVEDYSLLFIRERFNYPIFVDTVNSINQLNDFPQSVEYHCFLLDKDNKVLLIGNPILNNKIWDLYKSLISGKKQLEYLP